MSNKTQLQTNNAKLSSLIEVLEGKATGGGGDAPYVGEFASIIDNGMLEPGVDEYILDYSNHDIDFSKATFLWLGGNSSTGLYACCYQMSPSLKMFSNNTGWSVKVANFSINTTNKTIILSGTIDSSSIKDLGFKVYFD